MNPAKTIEPQTWMCEPQTRAVMDVLNGQSKKPQALFVGGCVRNTLLGVEVSDIDIATKHQPQEVIRLCLAAGMKTVPTGIEHGTVTIIHDDKTYEVTTLRKDVATDGRRATIEYAQDWDEDAQRRDFTMNTLLADCDGNIYDPTGQGLTDLDARRVIFVGDPETRIAEDMLRVLRFFRFHAYYGAGDPDPLALKSCAAAAGRISELSRERITQEIFKILSLPNPSPILSLMTEYGVMSLWRDADLSILEKLCAFQVRYDVFELSARLRVLGDAQSMEHLILIPKAIHKIWSNIDKVTEQPALRNDHALKVLIYKYGRIATMQSMLIQFATNTIGESQLSDVPRWIDLIKNWDIPKFPITGQDLIDQGFKPGRELGDTLRSLESQWMAQGFPATLEVHNQNL